MKRNWIFYSILSATLTAFGCGGAATNDTGANANTATVVNNAAANPIATNAGGIPNQPIQAATNSRIPGIPNAPANLIVSKNDPTRSPNVKMDGRPAPNDSEITTSLAQDVVQTRTFKTNKQIAKVEVIGSDKKTVRVYLRDGKVRDLPDGKIGDALSESPENILKAVTASGVEPPAAPNTAAPQQPGDAKQVKKRAQVQP